MEALCDALVQGASPSEAFTCSKQGILMPQNLIGMRANNFVASEPGKPRFNRTVWVVLVKAFEELRPCGARVEMNTSGCASRARATIHPRLCQLFLEERFPVL